MGLASENDAVPDEPSELVRELGEDVEVAILEFLDRHPRTSTRDIRLALRLIDRAVGDLAGRE